MHAGPIKPFLKWAGGKRQLLPELLPLVRHDTGKYIEPFIGGGALFFALAKPGCVIGDSNPELINTYEQIALNPDEVIDLLKGFKNEKDEFYRIRALDWRALPPAVAAARTIYLNHTCFNGLFRVNRKGQFNVPFGGYKNPRYCDEENLRAVSQLLAETTIVCSDFETTLERYAEPGDTVFLDPPYFPVSEYADFKRYTAEQFYQPDQERLARCAERLVGAGCRVILTNSNHPEVFRLLPNMGIRVVPTKRYISSNANTRRGEDLILTSQNVQPKHPLDQQMQAFPSTRFMGSKSKIVGSIWPLLADLDFTSVADLFSGSGVVSYMFKAQGKQVFSNDHMSMAHCYAQAMIENSHETLSDDLVDELVVPHANQSSFVQDTFRGLYFTDDENFLIDTIRANIEELENKYDRSIAMTALIRACMKKRPRGIFTYTGMRYNDGRADLRKTMETQFREAVRQVNAAVFSNGKECSATLGDALEFDRRADLVYLDPPYYSPTSDNQYVRRYHFVEGLARSWRGVEIQDHTKTKKFRSYPTPFSTYEGSVQAFRTIFERYKQSIIVVSYSSNSLPTKEELFDILHEYKKSVAVYPIDHRYSFGTKKTTPKNVVKEYIFIGC